MLKRLLSTLKGVGEKKNSRLLALGLVTFEDCLKQYPHRYVDRRKVLSVQEITDDNLGVIEAIVIRKRIQVLSKTRKEMMILEVRSHFNLGEIVYFSPKYIEKDFEAGNTYYFFGKLEKNGMLFKMIQPEYARHNDKRFLKIVPIYPLTNGISQREISQLHQSVLDMALPSIEETLPKGILDLQGLVGIKDALRNIHFPLTEKDYELAKHRIVFEELFELQLKLFLLKKNFHKAKSQPFTVSNAFTEWCKALPFVLTDAQDRVLKEIANDVSGGYVMNRLIQGDVGSGKTILAFGAILLSFENSKQSALLAPTALLAEQHYESFKSLFGDTIKSALLISKTPAAEKRAIKSKLEAGDLDVVIGTHAILQEDVIFRDLGLVIADEQHRFGIRQRLSAALKGNTPHYLIMSATPIPRTLSLILYGDMDVSILEEMPSGRKLIKTHFVKNAKYDEMYRFVEDQIKEGRQAYFVCPLVEESETLDLTDAQTHYESLKSIYPQYAIGLVHGKMKHQDRDEVMRRFKLNQIQVLVSTTVIEVGINVPNATVMVIVNSERFGLAQLHQLRGRVGRGAEQSYCFLLSDKLSKVSKERIQTLVSTASGFDIAEKDLALRGPGEIFGVRQHGLPELKLANLASDKIILLEAQKCVKIILAESEMGNASMVDYLRTIGKHLDESFTL